VSHLIHVISGRMMVQMDDGSETEFGPGDVGFVPPGHDAWIIGDQPFVSCRFMSSDHKKTELRQSAEQKRKESEEQLSLLQTITSELAAAGDLSSALKVVLRDVCKTTGWIVGHAWVPNEQGTALEFRSAWYCGDDELKPFRAVSEASQFKPGVGLPGRVWESKKTAWLEDVTNDPNFPRSAAARTARLRTGVGIPIVVTVLEFFMRESRAENERLLTVIASVAGQLDLFRRATRAEAAAREQQFRTLANSISQLAWMADGDGYIFWYNDRWYDYTGTTLEEMQGWGWQKVHHPNEVERVVERIKTAFKTGDPWEDTFPLRSKNGEYRWFLSRALPIKDQEGKVVRWFGTHTDVTEQREMERALRESRDELRGLNQELSRRSTELEAINKELEAFSYSVSHDLRAPLRHIAGYSELLQKNGSSLLDEKGRRYLATILESAERMGTLIDDLLAFAGIGRAETRKSMVSLERLVKEVQSEVSQETAGRNVTWKVGPLPELQGDKSMLKVVLVNLISNALKYTRTRPTPEIEIGSMNQEQDQIVVFIRDNGVGFDMKYASKLFGVFQRLHRSETFEGNGIGLATVQRIIHRHGGQVWAEGLVDRGATFYFSLSKSQGV
jgi:PAS domain S-box-containing protein